MSSSSSNVSKHGNLPNECNCELPVMSLTSWTPSNPARRFDCCPNRYKTGVRNCTKWDWYDPELDNDWYKGYLYEMYRALTPNQRVQVQKEVSSQEKVHVLAVEMEQLKVQLKKSQKSCLIWKSIVIMIVLAWFMF